MSNKEGAGKESQVKKQRPPQPVAEGLEAQQTGLDAAAAVHKAMAMPRPPLEPGEILALQRTAGNQAVQRLLADEWIGADSQKMPGLQGITADAGGGALAVQETRPPSLQRDNGDEAVSSFLGRSGNFPLNINRNIPVGGYIVGLQLNGQLQWSPFTVNLTGDQNRFVMNEGEEERANIRFSSDRLESFGVDLGSVAAELDSRGLTEASGEAGPVRVSWNRDERRLTARLDVLGFVWPPEMQALIEGVVEVTSDFSISFIIPEEEGAAIQLAGYSADLGVAVGPEQLRAIAELSIETTREEGLEYTTASGRVAVEVNVMGIEETFEIYEDEASGADLHLRHERQLVQTALRVAFAGTYPEIELWDPERRTAASMNELWRTFNFWYRDGYLEAQRRLIARYAEHDVENVRMHDGSGRIPIDIRGLGRIGIDPYCRENIRQVILPHPDPPGARIVNELWSNFIHPFEGSA
ncbi:MAG: hypothetical protein PVG33_01810 [Chloroflexota bacterium]|jgi:hypothetical protein